METQKDISYGVIPVIKDGDTWKVFLIYQYGSREDVYWTFPKGHLEKGELPEETAQRELEEETSIALEKLDTSKVYTQEYTFPYKNVFIEKSVVYYLGFAEDKNFSLQEEEVKDAGWFSLQDARDKLTHDMAKTMFDEVVKDLQ